MLLYLNLGCWTLTHRTRIFDPASEVGGRCRIYCSAQSTNCAHNRWTSKTCPDKRLGYTGFAYSIALAWTCPDKSIRRFWSYIPPSPPNSFYILTHANRHLAIASAAPSCRCSRRTGQAYWKGQLGYRRMALSTVFATLRLSRSLLTCAVRSAGALRKPMSRA